MEIKNSERHRAGNRRRNKRWRANNLEHAKALEIEKSLRHYYRNHEASKEKLKDRARKRHAATDPDKRRCARLRTAYGITLVQRSALLAAQGGTCGGCGTDKPGGRGWQVDHCHEKKTLRGILCSKCNTGLGLADHSTETLRRWITYLDRNA